MHGHPTLGVKNAKPRLSSRPDQKIGKLSEEYLGIRNRQMDLKAKKAAMEWLSNVASWSQGARRAAGRLFARGVEAENSVNPADLQPPVALHQ